MSQKIAALMYEIAAASDGVSNEIHLLPASPFRGNDGRPYDCENWVINATIAAQIIARVKSHDKPLLIDYDHLSMRWDRDIPVKAAGWCANQLEWREGQGLFAVNVEWTPKAKQEILDKEFRYISPVFLYLESTGEVLDVIAIALTNTPGLDDLDEVSIAALTRQYQQGDDMPKLEEQIAALTTERDNAKTQVAALTAERDAEKVRAAALTAQVATLEQEKTQAALTAEKKERDDFIVAALNTGKVPPAAKPVLEKLTSMSDLKEAVETYSPGMTALLTTQHSKTTETGAHGLSEAEMAMCTRMRVSTEDYLKNKGA